MKINSHDYRVKPEKKLTLAEWPTIGKPVCESKKKYHALLADHVDASIMTGPFRIAAEPAPWVRRQGQPGKVGAKV